MKQRIKAQTLAQGLLILGQDRLGRRQEVCGLLDQIERERPVVADLDPAGPQTVGEDRVGGRTSLSGNDAKVTVQVPNQLAARDLKPNGRLPDIVRLGGDGFERGGGRVS